MHYYQQKKREMKRKAKEQFEQSLSDPLFARTHKTMQKAFADGFEVTLKPRKPVTKPVQRQDW